MFAKRHAIHRNRLDMKLDSEESIAVLLVDQNRAVALRRLHIKLYPINLTDDGTALDDDVSQTLEH